MEKYDGLELEVIRFKVEDVITTSCTGDNGQQICTEDGGYDP